MRISSKKGEKEWDSGMRTGRLWSLVGPTSRHAGRKPLRICNRRKLPETQPFLRSWKKGGTGRHGLWARGHPLLGPLTNGLCRSIARCGAICQWVAEYLCKSNQDFWEIDLNRSKLTTTTSVSQYMPLDTGQKSSYKDQVSENRNAVKIRPGVVSRQNHWLQVKFSQILSKI